MKNHLVPVDKKQEQGNACYSLESTANLRQYLPNQNQNSNNNNTSSNLTERVNNKFGSLLKPEVERDALPSMIGNQIAKNLIKKPGKSETVISLKYEDKVLDIKTINIQQLVKKFAQRIFSEAKIDIKKGRYLLE